MGSQGGAATKMHENAENHHSNVEMAVSGQRVYAVAAVEEVIVRRVCSMR